MIKQYKLLFLISIIAILIPYLFISIYSNPAADDFTYAFKGKNTEFTTAFINEYFNWNGRYTSNAFVLINPLAFNSFILYKIAPVLIIILTFLSYLLFIKITISRFIKKIDIFIISLSLSLLFLYQMPIISEGIYWYTGAVTYQLGNIFALTYISLLLQYYKEQFIFKSKSLHLILLTFVLFLTIGFNEIIMIALLCFSSIFTYINYKNKLKHKRVAFFLFLITLILSSVVFFSPGNAIRESCFPHNHNIVHSMFFSFAQTLRFIFNWISSAPLLLFSILYFYLNKKLALNNKIFSVSFYLTPIHSSILLFLAVFIAIFPAYWTTGILGQHRTLNVAYFIFIIIWFVNLTVFFNFYKTKMKNIPNINKSIKFIFLFIILGSFIFTKNGYNVFTDIFYKKAESFNMQMNERYSLIKSSKDTIYFKPISNSPSCLFLYDITKNPENWQNKCYVIYFDCENKHIIQK